MTRSESGNGVDAVGPDVLDARRARERPDRPTVPTRPVPAGSLAGTLAGIVAVLAGVASRVRDRASLPPADLLSAVLLVAAVLALPAGFRWLLLGWVGGVAGAVALPFVAVWLLGRLFDRRTGPR